jgi:predicted dehydrogenase
MNDLLKVAIIGCGKIADSHLSQIQRIAGCKVIGACDREPLMAKQLAHRFKIRGEYSDVGAMLDDCRPDVVHITTPPGNHFELGKQCLSAGCHLYVEKPFTLNKEEAKQLIDFAHKVGKKVTVGHDLQFSHAARRMRQLVKDGYLGGGPVHLESYYCYDLSEPGYAKALLADTQHWVRRLPGKLLHNIISHGIARIAEFLGDNSPKLIAHGFVSPLLRSLAETEIIDELRVIISEVDGATAYFTFSSQMRPSLNQFRIYGAKNGIIVDEDHQTVIKCPGNRLKSYAEKFVSPLKLARQQVENVAVNGRKFLANDFHMKAGMKYLIETFYRSIKSEAPLPISYREIILTSQLMDEIFRQINQPTDAPKRSTAGSVHGNGTDASTYREREHSPDRENGMRPKDLQPESR